MRKRGKPQIKSHLNKKFIFTIIKNEKELEAISSWDKSHIPNYNINEKTEEELRLVPKKKKA